MLGADDLNDPWNPAWLDEEAVTRLKNGSLGPARAGGITDQAIASWRGGPMALLQAMLLNDTGGQDLDASASSALADSVWGPLVLGAARGIPMSATAALRYAPAARVEADPLWEALRALRPDEDLPDPAGTDAQTSGSVFTSPHLALAVQLTGTSTTGMALVLDDSNEALESPDHAEAWLAWLRFSNVLALAQAPVDITTTSLALNELRDRAAAEAVATAAGASPEAMSDLGWNDVDRELTPPAVLALLPHLATAGVAHGEDGVEVAGGIMTDLSWRDQRVAVVADPLDEDVNALTTSGWRVVGVGDNTGENPAELAARITALLEGH